MSDLLPALLTTIGTLAGSFGGFMLAARAQRKQADVADARGLRDADRARLIVLEDERHTFQLKTLMALQELVRRQTRSALLVIEQDRQTVSDGLGYRLLPYDDPDDFTNTIDLSHHIARVTNPKLRTRLENFASLCAVFSIPPDNDAELDQQTAAAEQHRRRRVLLADSNATTALLGEHLRNEIDRHERNVSDTTATSPVAGD